MTDESPHDETALETQQARRGSATKDVPAKKDTTQITNAARDFLVKSANESHAEVRRNQQKHRRLALPIRFRRI